MSQPKPDPLFHSNHGISSIVRNITSDLIGLRYSLIFVMLSTASIISISMRDS